MSASSIGRSSDEAFTTATLANTAPASLRSSQLAVTAGDERAIEGAITCDPIMVALMRTARESGERSARRLAIAACRPSTTAPELEELVRGVRVDALVSQADYHRVASTLHDRLDGVDGVAKRLSDELLALRLAAQVKRLDAQRALLLLQRVLDVPFLVVKGPVLSSHWYPRDRLRDFNDLDLLVAPADFGHVVEALCAEGAVPRASNWHGFRAHGVAEVPLRLGSTTIDLHWDLVALAEHRSDIRFPTHELFEHAVTVPVGELEVRTLDPVDTLLHLCVNTGLGDAHRLRNLVDVDVVVGSGRVDLGEFAVRSDRLGLGRLCSAVLQRTVSVLGTELPEGFLAELSPSRSWLLANAVIDRAGLWIGGHASVASSRLIAAGRSSAPATAAAFGRATRRAVLERVGHPSLGQVGGDLDWQRLPADGDIDAHRRRYFNYVAGQARRVRRVRCRDADELHRRIGALQPRTTPMLGAALIDGLCRRGARADLFEFGDGTLAAVVVRYRWTLGRVMAYPLLLDAAAARSVADFLQRSSVTELAGLDRDTNPLRAHLPRWRGAVATTSASQPPGFVWADPPDDVRAATQDDLDDLVDAFWRYSPHGYPNKWLLRRRLRRSIDQLVLVVEAGTPPVPAGFGVIDSSTPEYDYWAQVVIVPEHRQEGLSWHLVAAGAAHAASRGVGGLVFVADSNPMTLPDDSTADEAWNFVDLSPPRRFRGEVRIRRLVDATLAFPSRNDGDVAPADIHRTPGGSDALVSERRSQRWWRDHIPGSKP